MGNGWREYEAKKGFLDGSYESNLPGAVGLWGCGAVGTLRQRDELATRRQKFSGGWGGIFLGCRGRVAP